MSSADSPLNGYYGELNEALSRLSVGHCVPSASPSNVAPEDARLSRKVEDELHSTIEKQMRIAQESLQRTLTDQLNAGLMIAVDRLHSYRPGDFCRHLESATQILHLHHDRAQQSLVLRAETEIAAAREHLRTWLHDEIQDHCIEHRDEMLEQSKAHERRIAEVRDELRDELYDELRDELYNELRDELQDTIRGELHEELRSEIEVTLFRQLRAEVARQINAEWGARLGDAGPLDPVVLRTSSPPVPERRCAVRPVRPENDPEGKSCLLLCLLLLCCTPNGGSTCCSPRTLLELHHIDPAVLLKPWSLYWNVYYSTGSSQTGTQARQKEVDSRLEAMQAMEDVRRVAVQFIDTHPGAMETSTTVSWEAMHAQREAWHRRGKNPQSKADRLFSMAMDAEMRPGVMIQNADGSFQKILAPTTPVLPLGAKREL